MKKVLFIAELSQGYYYKPFIDACTEKNIEFYVFDPSMFPKDLSISIDFSKNQGQVGGFVDTVVHKGTGDKIVRLPLQEIDVAWYIREGFNRKNLDSLELCERFSENECRGVFHSLLSVLDCKWVNRKEDMDYILSNKLYQQLIAYRCGLTVPKTVVGNDPESIIAFCEENNGLLLKSIGCINLDQKNEYFVYAQRWNVDEITNQTISIKKCPLFAQKYVDKRFEHRVMVIGGEVLSCQIDSQASEMTKTDWRHYDFDNVAHTKSLLPKAIQLKLKEFMKRIRLNFGALDMIETTEGDFVFLEINPSGQWGWIAEFANLPIAQATAKMLQKI